MDLGWSTVSQIMENRTPRRPRTPAGNRALVVEHQVELAIRQAIEDSDTFVFGAMVMGDDDDE